MKRSSSNESLLQPCVISWESCRWTIGNRNSPARLQRRGGQVSGRSLQDPEGGPMGEIGPA